MANEKTLIRGAFILTMDEALGTIHDGAVCIEGDRITVVGRGLATDGAEVIDGTDCIVLPGFVDTHRHMWGAMLRGCACYGDLSTYFHDVVFTYGANYTPEDTYASVRFGLAEAVDAGITTLHAWEHNLQTRGHAEAAIAALRASGLRGRFSYGFSSDPNASVWVDGVPRKRGGALVGVDVAGLVRSVQEAVAGLSRRIGKAVA